MKWPPDFSCTRDRRQETFKSEHTVIGLTVWKMKLDIKMIKLKLVFGVAIYPSTSVALKKGEIAYTPVGLRPTLTEVNGKTGIEFFLPALRLRIKRKPRGSMSTL